MPVRYTQDGGAGGGGGAVTIGPNFGDGSPTAVMSVGAVTVQGVTTGLLADKDSWCDVIAACPVDVNHDATDLQLDSIVATRKDMIVGWDLSAYPTGATVTSAIVTVGLKTAPTTSADLIWDTIAEANEGWTEATVKCSTIPAGQNFSIGSVAVGTAAGPRDLVVALSSVARTRIGERMGVGSFSLRGLPGVGLTNCVFESADEGTDNALGPRLTFTWNRAL